MEPNRVYVLDAGNSRVLGFSNLGTCMAGANQGNGCTSNSDCPSSFCQIPDNRPADIVLGQSNFNSSACNGDSGFQNYPNEPQAGPNTLCGMKPSSVSTAEAGTMATMSTDNQGNFYITDSYNHRVLRYDNPFVDDGIADYVWGQTNFTDNSCNQTGYRGRVGIFEIMVMSQEIRNLVLQNALPTVIKRKAMEKGMITLMESGLNKVIQGITSIDEVLSTCVEEE